MKFSKMQILVTGVYRSGTEYFTNLLGQHPNITASMYTINSLRFMYDKYGKKKINNKKLLHDLERRLWDKHKFKIKINKTKLFKLKKYGAIYDFLMSQIYCNRKKKIWAEKNQLLWRQTDLFLKTMNNGKVIHILRDPRNVMASFKKYTNSKKPNYLSSALNSLDAMMYCRKHLNNKDFLIIKYEDLLDAPDKEMSKVFNFLNLKNKKIRTKKSYFINKTKWIVNSSFQSNITSSKSFNHSKSLNSYKKNLTLFDRMFVEKICGKYMKLFAYNSNFLNKDLKNVLITKKLKKNKFMKDVFKKWVKTGKGIQMFPTNPLDSKTWDR